MRILPKDTQGERERAGRGRGARTLQKAMAACHAWYVVTTRSCQGIPVHDEMGVQRKRATGDGWGLGIEERGAVCRQGRRAIKSVKEAGAASLPQHGCQMGCNGVAQGGGGDRGRERERERGERGGAGRRRQGRCRRGQPRVEEAGTIGAERHLDAVCAAQGPGEGESEGREGRSGTLTRGSTSPMSTVSEQSPCTPSWKIVTSMLMISPLGHRQVRAGGGCVL